MPKATEVPLIAADGVHITAWFAAPQGDKPVIVYFHGNGGSLRYGAARFRQLIGAGIGLVALEYRGYGGNEGSPSEDGLIADGEAAYAYAAAHYPAKQIVLWGQSLGSGVAVAVAAEKPVARVILEAPFTSTAAVASIRYWYIPVSLLMKDQFHSDRRIQKVTAPLLILHGVKDQRRALHNGRAPVRTRQQAEAHRAFPRRRTRQSRRQRRAQRGGGFPRRRPGSGAEAAANRRPEKLI